MLLVAFIVFLAVIVAAVMAPTGKVTEHAPAKAPSFPLLEGAAD
jgi:hypothetical protein